MCEIYVKADPMLYESRSRSLRIHGGVTKIRLENHFWDILAEIAASDGYTTNQLIAKLYDELLDYRGGLGLVGASILPVALARTMDGFGSHGFFWLVAGLTGVATLGALAAWRGMMR